MNVEQPPRDTAFSLSSYLTRMFTKAFEDINRASAAFLVRDNVKNPVKGKLYLVESDGLTQFSDKGLYYYDGVNFTKLAQGSITSLTLGVTHDKAYYGDFGNTAYLHSQETGNAHNLDYADATHTGLLYAADWVSFRNKQDRLDFASATVDGILRKSDWSVFRNKQDVLGFTPENIANKVITWSSPTDVQYPSAKLVSDTFANYLPLSSYHLYYKGKFTTLAALTTAIPVASPGDYAQVDAGIADNVVNYNWDDEAGWVVGSSGSGATDTDGLPEGSTNLYFTVSRVLATLLTGFSSSTGAISSTDTILTAFNKVVGNFNTPASYPTLNQNTTGSAAKLTTARTIDGVSFDGTTNITVIAEGTHAAASKTTPADNDELPLVDSAAGNVLKKLTWANLKATLKTYFDTLYAVAPAVWTPTITGLTAGTGGTITARWKPLPGNLAFFSLDIVFGTSSTNSTTWKFTLPAATISGHPTYAAIASNAYMYTGGYVYLIMPILTSTTEVTINLTDATTASIFGKALTANMFASGNLISISGTYETA